MLNEFVRKRWEVSFHDLDFNFARAYLAYLLRELQADFAGWFVRVNWTINVAWLVGINWTTDMWIFHSLVLCFALLGPSHSLASSGLATSLSKLGNDLNGRLACFNLGMLSRPLTQQSRSVLKRIASILRRQVV